MPQILAYAREALENRYTYPLIQAISMAPVRPRVLSGKPEAELRRVGFVLPMEAFCPSGTDSRLKRRRFARVGNCRIHGIV